MANTIGYGQGAVNNTNAWGQGAKVGSPSFSNLQSLEFDGIDDYVDLGSSSTVADGGQFSFSFWIKAAPAPSTGQTYLFSANYYNLHTFWVVNGTDFRWLNINNTPKNLSLGVLDNYCY